MSMSNRARSTLVALTGILLLGIAVQRFSQRQPQAYHGPVERIVLAAEMVPHASPVWIAEDRGYFREQGIELQVRACESGRTALRNMLNQPGIDMATAAQTPVIHSSFHRDDYAIVAGMVYSDTDIKLLARRDRGIAAAQDLKGKTVGITSGSSGHFFLSLFLAHHWLQLSDVKTADLEPARLARALAEGEVDAIATWEPHIHRAQEALGDRAVLFPSRAIYREDFYFVASKPFIAQRSAPLKRFLRAIEKAQQFILKNRRQAMDIVQRRLNLQSEILDATWDEYVFGLFLDQSILDSLEDEARWAVENGLATDAKMPNYLGFIHSEALKAIKPEAVTVAGR
ncbi:MAG: ABC transporter substrate-binding protein [Pirellulales bacterium]|nr:ABC transporter substrate-binding protein [Pirellulales bacterium]